MKPTFRILAYCLILVTTCGVASAQGVHPRSQISGTMAEISAGHSAVGSPDSAPRYFGPPLQGPGEMTLHRSGPPGSVGYAVAVPFGPWILLDGRFGQGIGYDDSYFHVRTFLPKHIDPGRSLFYGMIAGGSTEEAEGLLNAGAGTRYYAESLDRVFGASAWFDADDSHEETYYRVGGSFESLGRYLDLFVNVYFVLDDDRELVSSGITGDPLFQGNNIVFPFQQTFEAPYSGGDFEVGGLLPFFGRHGIYGYVGGYYLDSSETGFDDTFGVKARADIAASEDLTVGVNFSNDDCFGTNTWVSVAYQFPYKRQRRWFKPRKVKTRLASTVHRQDRIPVKEKRFDSTILAIDPFDTKPFFVYHVDPDGPAGGDGTFENPFNMMESARTAITLPGDMTDIIRVLPRGDNTGTNLAMTAPLVLNDRIRLLSTTISHTFTATQGTFTLPGFTGAGLGPLVTNSAISSTAGPAADSVITLADNNEVSGFRIHARNAAGTDRGDGIDDAGTVIGFNINNNSFLFYRNAVVLSDAVGTVAAGAPGLFTINTMTGSSDGSGASVDGFQLTTSSGTLDLLVNNNVSTGNSDDGYELTASGPAAVINADASVVAGTNFSSNTAIANGTGGQFTATGGGTINIAFIGNTFDDNTDTNTGANFLATGATSAITVSSFTGNTVTDSLIGNGVRLGAEAGGMLTVTGFTGNTITGHGLSGVLMAADGAGSVIDATLGTSGAATNFITDNGLASDGDGIRGMATADSVIRGAIVNNDLSRQGATDPDDPSTSNSIYFTADDSTIDFGTTPARLIAENIMSDNRGGGLIATAENQTAALDAMHFVVDDNTIGTSAAPNGGAGVDVSSDGGVLNLTATDNVLDSNVGVGIGYTQIQTATGAFTITGNRIIRTADDDDVLTSVAGEGIGIRQIGSDALPAATNTLTASLIDNNRIGDLADDTLGNDGHGVLVDVREDSTLTSLTIGNEDGDNDNGNRIGNNGLDGVNFRRRESATVDDVRMVDNIVMFNSDGFDISAENTVSDDINILVEDNHVTENNANGFNLTVRADAVLNIDIIDNYIDRNQSNGIRTDEQTNDATDLRGITGFWHTNIITNNLGHGITSNAALGDSIITSTDLAVGLAGVDAEGKSRANLIDLNGLSGVQIDGPGTSVWTNNTITRNGQLATTLDLVGHGFDIQGRPFLSVTLNDNQISENLRDGLEIRQSELIIGGSVEVFATGNSIRDNGGRGVDILNARDNQFMEVALVENIITGNGFEGVFVVNTASSTQDQTGTIDDATELASDGAFDNAVFLDLIVDDNRIESNGSGSNFQGTGLVMLVGSMHGGHSFTDDGGFADTRGGVIAEVTDNTFGGNFGVDVYIQSFRSTGNPPTTDGEWTDTDFEVDSYEGDPKSRLDLLFTGNSGDSINVTPTFTVDSNSTLAFYENAEGTFKSREDDATDPGPFTTGDRRRNAQRLDARLGLGPATPGGASDSFLYSGIGQSTFRADVSGNTFTFLANGFIFDTSPYNDVGDANGATFPGAVFGELPFGWTDFTFP